MRCVFCLGLRSYIRKTWPLLVYILARNICFDCKSVKFHESLILWYNIMKLTNINVIYFICSALFSGKSLRKEVLSISFCHTAQGSDILASLCIFLISREKMGGEKSWVIFHMRGAALHGVSELERIRKACVCCSLTEYGVWDRGEGTQRGQQPPWETSYIL